MARWGSDPKVQEWMKEHPNEVGRIERLYNLLRNMDSEVLIGLAHEVMVDLVKHRAQFRDRLIADIVKTAPEKALEIVLGQSVLPLGRPGDETKGG